MPHRQLSGPVAAADGAARVVLSASKELEPGARAMILMAPGLFRVDVMVRADTMRTVVRNQSGGQLEMGPIAGVSGTQLSSGDVAVYQPRIAGLRFTLGDARDGAQVVVTLATLRFAERGTVRVTAQAVIRDTSGDSDPRPPRT